MRLAKAYTAQPATITSWPAGSRSYRHFSLLGERGQGAERAVELQAVLERGHGTLAGVTVQLRVHPWCLPSRASTAEPALWRAAQASLGDGPPLPYPSLEPPCQPLPPQLRPGG